MTKTPVLVCAAILVGATGFVLSRQDVPDVAEVAVNPEAEFKIGEQDMKALRAKALHGECEASRRLGEHFVFVALDDDEAIRWYRIAANCPDAESQKMLVLLLLSRRNQPGVLVEIDRLVDEIRKGNPEAAESMREEIKLRMDTAK